MEISLAGITGMSRFDVIDSVKIIILKRFAVVSSFKISINAKIGG